MFLLKKKIKSTDEIPNQNVTLSDDLSASTNIAEENFNVDHDGKKYVCNAKRLCETSQSIIMYDTTMDANAKFIVNKALNKLTLSAAATDEEVSQMLNNNEHIAVEHYINHTKELTQSSAVVDLKELLQMYPQIVIDLIKGDVNQFATKLDRELKEKDNKVSTVTSVKDVVWKHETINEKTVTIVKCLQKSSDEGVFRVNLTFTTMHVDLTTWRCTFIKGISGKQVLGVRDIQLLLRP
ncbi:unnamed protein product [Adineta steineri]|uniref:Uncharacterized protein n=1 Tax=Adineta steineri TaxID=433720 RepID=A0A815BEQ1_9BILA|nr:unnamed protein product [Adineta steineri]CAF3965684.1 unnamed protein product [Adineta steineri]